MKFARVENNTVIEFRDFNEADIPAHKRSLWLPVIENDPPEFDSHSQYVLGPIQRIDVDAVYFEYFIHNRSANEMKQKVKDEAGRRITNIFPTWKQINMIARGVELQNIRLQREWTTEESQEAAQLQQAWDTIKLIRNRSNILESMETIPSDYRSDDYWI